MFFKVPSFASDTVIMALPIGNFDHTWSVGHKFYKCCLDNFYVMAGWIELKISGNVLYRATVLHLTKILTIHSQYRALPIGNCQNFVQTTTL